MEYLKQKYWHEFRHCSRWHSTKLNQNKVLWKKNTNRKCSNENEIKNEIKVKSKYRHECQHCSCQHSTKIKKIKFLNRQIEIQNEIMENQIENYIKVK